MVLQLLEDVQFEASQFQRGCEKLWAIGTELVEFVENEVLTDDRLKECIMRDVPELMKEVKSSLGRLKQKECPILVTGISNAVLEECIHV